MNLPFLDNIIIEDRKISNYLLNVFHPDGGIKAKFFISRGFDKESLKNVLIKQAKEIDVKTEINIKSGLKYIIESTVESPDGRLFMLRSVWIVYLNEKFIKLITAYPVKIL